MKVTPWLSDLILVVLVRRWMMQFTMSVKWSYLEKLIMGEIALRKGKIKEKLEDEYYCCCSLTQLCLTLRPHGLQHTRLPYPSPSPRFCSNSCPLSQWCHPTISSAVAFFPLFSIFACIRVFSNELALCIRWPKYCSFSISKSLQWMFRVDFL